MKLGAKEVEDDVEAACYEGWLLRRMVVKKVKCYRGWLLCRLVAGEAKADHEEGC